MEEACNNQNVNNLIGKKNLYFIEMDFNKTRIKM